MATVTLHTISGSGLTYLHAVNEKKPSCVKERKSIFSI